MINNLYRNTILLILIPAVFVAFYPGRIILITMLCFYPLLFKYWIFFWKERKVRYDGIPIVRTFILHNILLFIWGIFSSKSSEDYTVLLGSSIFTFILFPIMIHIFSQWDPKPYIKEYLKYGIIAAFVTLLLEAKGMMDFPHMVSGVYLLILIIPFIRFKYKTLIILLALFSFYYDMSVRSNMINISFAFFLIVIYYILPIKKRFHFYIFLNSTLIISPIVFLLLGITGVFNIFKISEYKNYSYTAEGRKGERDLLVDSRTGIYEDVFFELKKQNAEIWGLGGVGKTETYLSDKGHAHIYKEGRRGTESGMLNYFQWGGIIGALLYFILMAKASVLALYSSNNWFSKILGVWISFKLLFSFIEDKQTNSIHYFLIILSIGICYNQKIRNFTDKQIRIYLQSIIE